MFDKFFQSSFSKLATISEEIQENTYVTAMSVSVGGDLYSRIDALVKILEKQAKEGGSAAGGGGPSPSKLKAIGAAMKPIGQGLSYVVEALNKLDDPKKADAMKKIAESLVMLGDVGKAILKFAAFMILAVPLLLVLAIASPIIALGLWTTINAILWSTKKLDQKAMDRITMLGEIGLQILIFAASLALVALIGPWALQGAAYSAAIILGLALVLKILKWLKFDSQAAEDLGEALAMLGLGLLVFVGSIALISFIIDLAWKGFTDAMLMLAAVMGVFMLLRFLGLTKTIEVDAKAFAMMGLAILALAVALWLFNMIYPGFDVAMQAMLVVGAVGAVFAIIGLASWEIETGAKALMWASLAMVIVALALLIVNWIIPPGTMGWETFAPLLIVSGVGAVFAIIGLAAPEIYFGASALIEAGISMIIVAIGMWLMSKSLNEGGWDLVLQTLALIGGIGIEMGLAGLASPFILAGAAAMMVAGISLILIAVGVKMMHNAIKDGADKTLLKETKKGPVLFTLLRAIADGFVMWPWEAAGVLIGAGAMVVAGFALISIGKGIQEFQKAAANTDLKTLGDNVTTIIGTLAVPFSKIGGGGWLDVKNPATGKTEKVFFKGGSGGLFGSSNPVADGVRAVRGMGEALTNIAIGMQNMANLQFPMGFDKEGKATGYFTLDSDTAVKVIDNTAYMVGALAVPFAKIGKGGKSEVKNPITGATVQVDFGAPQRGGMIAAFFNGGSDVAKGISTTMNMGEALSNIASGMQNMANLKFPTGWDKDGKATGYETMASDTAIKVTENTQYLVGALAVPFAKIGMGGYQMIKNPLTGAEEWVNFGKPAKGGLMAWITGDEGVVAKGIKYTLDLGTVLVNLAKGVQDMGMLKFPEAFDKDGKATGWHKMTADDAVKVTENTRMLISSLTSTFAEIGGSAGAQGDTWWGGKSNVTKGIDMVRGFAEPISSLAQTVKLFSEMKFATGYDKDGKATGYQSFGDASKMTKKVTENVKVLIKGLVHVFKVLGSGEKDRAWYDFWSGESDYDKGVAIAKKLGAPFKSLAEASKGAATILEKVKDPQKVEETVKRMVAAVTNIGKDVSTSQLQVQINLIYAVKALYNVLSYAVPKVAAGLQTFDVAKAKSFMSIFAGETKGEEFQKKNAMIGQLTHTYRVMSWAIPKVTEAVSSSDMGLIYAFAELIGGTTKNTNTIAAKSKMYWQVGETYNKLGYNVPGITSAINSFNSKKGEAFKSMWVGPVNSFMPSAGYDAQSKLWGHVGFNVNKIGASMPGIAGAINSMDFAKLKEARIMIQALGVLAHGGRADDILAKLGTSLEKAIKRLSEMIEELSKELGGSKGSKGSGPQGPIPGGKPANVNLAPVVAALKALQATIDDGIEVSPRANTKWPHS